MPVVDNVTKYTKKLLSWDGDAQRIPTKENQFIWVDATARWYISDVALFYETVGKETGLTVQDDGDLMTLLTDLAKVRQEYDKVAPALQEAYKSGYGIVSPGLDELALEDPEIVRQGGRYSLKMKASAPSIHMIRADIETTVSPIVGDEKQSEDMVNYLLQQFEGDTNKLWQTNIFGRSFNEIVGDDLQSKLKRMPEPAQKKMREALERIINEGGGGLICIIL